MFFGSFAKFYTCFRPIYKAMGQLGPNLTWFSDRYASQVPVGFFGAFLINIKQVTASQVGNVFESFANFRTHFGPIYKPVGQLGPNLTWFSKRYASQVTVWVFLEHFQYILSDLQSLMYVWDTPHHLNFHPKALCCRNFVWETQFCLMFQNIYFFCILMANCDAISLFVILLLNTWTIFHNPENLHWWKHTLVILLNVKFPKNGWSDVQRQPTTTTTPKLNFIILLNVKCLKNGWSDVQRQPPLPPPPLNSIRLCRLRKFSCQTLGWWWWWWGWV